VDDSPKNTTRACPPRTIDSPIILQEHQVDVSAASPPYVVTWVDIKTNRTESAESGNRSIALELSIGQARVHGETVAHEIGEDGNATGRGFDCILRRLGVQVLSWELTREDDWGELTYTGAQFRY